MELVLFLILLTTIALCLVVGWVSEKRGRGFALGFWLSLFFTPLIGLLVLIALGDQGSKTANTIAALEWARVNNSLDVRDYDDFVQALPGTEEATLALKQKRMIQDWQAIDHLDGRAIEHFIQRRPFSGLSDEIHRVLKSNAAQSATCSDLLERMKAEEQRKREEKDAEEKRLNEEKARSLIDKQAQDRETGKLLFRATAAVSMVSAAVWLFFWWSDQNETRRIQQEADDIQESIISSPSGGLLLTPQEAGERAESIICADEEISLSSAEARERTENKELRSKIQRMDAELTGSTTSSAQKDKLTEELSVLRNQLLASPSYRDLDVARENFYACQRSAGE